MASKSWGVALLLSLLILSTRALVVAPQPSSIIQPIHDEPATAFHLVAAHPSIQSNRPTLLIQYTAPDQVLEYDDSSWPSRPDLVVPDDPQTLAGHDIRTILDSVRYLSTILRSFIEDALDQFRLFFHPSGAMAFDPVPHFYLTSPSPNVHEAFQDDGEYAQDDPPGITEFDQIIKTFMHAQLPN